MYIIKFGGSRLRPKEDHVDESCINFLINLTKQHPKKKFLFIIGGGALARTLQKKGTPGLKSLFAPDEDLFVQGIDLLGIRATRENGRLLIKAFKSANLNVSPTLLHDPTNIPKDNHLIHVAGGWKPGWSTDYVAMKFAQKFRAKTVIKVSDFKYVKDVSPLSLKDLTKPEINKQIATAKDLKNITWKKIANLVGTKWVPGLHTPLDPLAAALGLKNKDITLYIAEENQIENILNNEKVTGTIVSN